jgi:hypothetical protein
MQAAGLIGTRTAQQAAKKLNNLRHIFTGDGETIWARCIFQNLSSQPREAWGWCHSFISLTQLCWCTTFDFSPTYLQCRDGRCFILLRLCRGGWSRFETLTTIDFRSLVAKLLTRPQRSFQGHGKVITAPTTCLHTTP